MLRASKFGNGVTLNGSIAQTKDLSIDLGLTWSANANEIIALTGETQVDPDTGETILLILLILWGEDVYWPINKQSLDS